jgi:hypothetical protein
MNRGVGPAGAVMYPNTRRHMGPTRDPIHSVWSASAIGEASTSSWEATVSCVMEKRCSEATTGTAPIRNRKMYEGALL